MQIRCAQRFTGHEVGLTVELSIDPLHENVLMVAWNSP